MVAGHAVTADEIGQLQPLMATKSADQSVTSSTTLVNDNELFVALSTSITYQVDWHFIYEGSTAGDFKYGFTYPAGATMSWGHTVVNPTLGMDASSAFAYQRAGSGAAFACGGNGAGQHLHIVGGGLLIVGGTAGNLQVQFAQNTSDGTASKMNLDSWLRLQRTG
jgi:hypothetical protein